jgi:mannose-6-phosphate isomerase-like protein (cupin superfamily)
MLGQIQEVVMVQAADMHRPFHLQLLPMGAMPDRVTNLEIVQHAVGDRTLSQQNLLSLSEGVKLPDICDERDLTIAIFSGTGHLIVQGEGVHLEPGVFIFIPAFTPHMLQATSQLTFLLSRCESTATTSESAWVINL